ncbi:c-type cytochrome biogenesis protein CcsB [Psychroserpens sp.]|uniref:c-type cytochrome biogenesis protein CcsB n=1 Tax=Psychroserpens sp. TaxID=2020870 RepID=UPI001B011EC6|nr:c-type cytochrome biogenesis protein CcsB [Psychroserpens sp.]MBO6605800.1 c-type cytochrome biogenesis protein CcsB [Psychroserpens sp.]MBO6630234.1 c-type cytochrome biogenesis protein CcsB [Psychroserpens sp.]MBO6652829.1 c-type cytochrome biogenesis protein CcsB [Psychroserpens sp.]MBO6681399.1 c-type cytochrome biogenesis protein CcsB [Psychroserpens sp.]MBO6749174.1 c-type cytochrome biogenesis protein CcsB [Psychroserpens sp.]
MKLLKKITSIIISTRLTAILFLLFAAAMGIATFIENDFNTETSKALVFNTWWFNGILLLFIINFLGNIKRYRLLNKDKISILLLHFSFIIIILGAGITRYVSFEGIMPINEGETSSILLSDQKYIIIAVDDNHVEKTVEKKLLLAQNRIDGDRPFKIAFLDFVRGGNSFSIVDDFWGIPFEVSYLNYVPNAKSAFKESKSGESHLHFVESSGKERKDHYLKLGARLSFPEADVSFQNIKEGVVNIYYKGNDLYIKSHRELSFTVMATQQTGVVTPMIEQKLKIRTLYELGDFQFVVPSPVLKGNLVYEKAGSIDDYPLDMLKVNLNVNGESREVEVFGAKFFKGTPQKVTINNLNFTIAYGSKTMKLPFAIKLNDFILEKYPGSNSPKSFMSRLTIKSSEEAFDYDVFMNNVLDHNGYRLFQSSYDEAGGLEKTILSVNHDKIGTWVTYVGYMLLFSGLIMMLMSPTSFFSKQRKKLRKLKTSTLTIVLIFLGLLANAQSKSKEEKISVLETTRNIPIEYVDEFSKIILQDPGGRMKPMNTFGSELLRKLTKKDKLQDLSSDQVVLSLFCEPEKWKDVPMVFITKKNSRLRDKLGIPHEQKFAALSVFFDSNGRYVLADEVSKASKKKIKNKYEQSVMDVDGRVILLYLAIQGDLFKLIPLPNDDENTWLTIRDAKKREFTDSRLMTLVNTLTNYKVAIKRDKVQESNASELLLTLKDFQEKYGNDIIPSKNKVELELFYNKYDIFKNLFWQYMMSSLLLFVVVIISVFKDKSKIISILTKVAIAIVVLLFAYHTIGLIIRWYISGHAPWSNGYESMIYVAWATLFFGLVVGRKSGLTIASTTFVTSMILMVAHWNWMDPSIGNLVPVLDSYWLMIHVAIIVASYGPFAIGMILGMLTLLLFILKNKKNEKKLNKVISELTIINELALTIGLVMLTVGNFLGAIWANESWGRYWGWDPKETWALISIMVYAFIIHMRVVPGLRGKLKYNIASVFAFSAILMTYLGVNHLLSGLHSYAAGEAAPIPNEIIGWLIVSALLSLFAILKNRTMITS